MKYNEKEFDKDMETFYRRIKLTSHFGINDNNTKLTEEEIFKPPSNKKWTPNQIHHTVQTFIEATTKDIEVKKLEKKEKSKKNLTKEEIDALNNLKQREDIIISNADKGGAVVIQDVKDYILEAEDQLNNQSDYKQLDYNPTEIHKKLVNQVIERFKRDKTLKEKVAEGLKVENPRTPKFYTLPKIHKKGNPGRPVISSIDCTTSKISKYVDFHLQPLVRTIPSYIKDTNDFLNKIKNTEKLPENSYLVTMDVKSLYTNIPNFEGIAATRKWLQNSPLQSVLTKVVTTFLALILTLNNFMFNSKNYMQIRGCAMGSICAPSYANIFMAEFEKKYIYPNIQNKSKMFLRYIDDIFMIWTGNHDELTLFLKKLNQQHTSIKFDFKISKESIAFLDTLVYIDQNNSLQTTIYTKEINQQNFLHRKLAHPFSLKKSIPFGQSLRIKQICSTEEEFERHSNILVKKFVSRGYKQSEITAAIEKSKGFSRNELLNENSIKKIENRIPLTLTYNQQAPNI